MKCHSSLFVKCNFFDPYTKARVLQEYREKQENKGY